MGDSGCLKKDVKRRSHKSGKINRIVSLFEIPRPSKSKGLQRTNSLPASKRPSMPSSEEDGTGSLSGLLSKMHHIKEELECKQQTKKKHSGARKKLNQETWSEDRDKIMDDLCKLQERIEDVTPEIENSDTELEITHGRTREDKDVIERDELTEEDRLSGETVIDRTSSETIREDSDEVSFVSYHAFASRDTDEEHDENALKNSDNDAATEDATDKAEDEAELVADDTFDIDPEDVVEDKVDSIAWWKHKSFVQINHDKPPFDDESPELEGPSSTTGRFIKNSKSRRSRRNNDRRRTGVLHKPHTVQELTRHFESFKDAAECGETELYRKSFIDEMDKELENMKNDGFKEDFHLSFDNLTILNYDEDVEERQDNDNTALFQTFMILSDAQDQDNLTVQEQDQDQDDLYGETLFSEDLEKGLYYLETYNADGKELIMCSVQIDRQSVDLNSFDEMKARSRSNVLANDDRTLVLLEGGSKSGSDSKRTTIYSTTSGESCEDEGIDIELGLNPYNYARRETYCDDQGVVRIERVAPYTETSQDPSDCVSTANNYYYTSQGSEAATIDEEEDNYYESIRLEHEIHFSVPKVKKDTLQYILEEIKSTERKYVADMGKVLREYKTFLEERCPEKVDVVFANMDQLYKVQLEFSRALEESDDDVKDIVQAFIDFEDLFRLYPRYFRNTPKANAAVKELSFLIKEKQDRINDKLDLSAYLLTPLQRLGKYKLFLEHIVKQLEKEERSVGSAQMALEIVKKYMSKGNDAVAVASILHSPLHTKDYGSFITREKFMLLKPKRMEMMVFLFEGAVVFTTEDLKNMEQFVYHQSIKTNDLRIATFDDITIHLTDYTKTKKRNSSKYTYVLDAKNAKLKATWKQQVEDILWKQMMKIKENTLKEYQSGTKTPKKAQRSREGRSKSTGFSTFYVE